MDSTDISLLRLEEDIKYLNNLIVENLKDDHETWRPNDEEFTRQWELYSQIREELLSLDPNLFKNIREIHLPEPDKSNSITGAIYYGSHLKPLKNEIIKIGQYFTLLKRNISNQRNTSDALSSVVLLTKRFHKIARQIRNRHSNRPTIFIEDEYDVQDLFHALLTLCFEDIRPEEWTPSYAGSSSRMDFLLKTQV